MKNTIIVYWSGTGNTEIMADKIKEGLENKGVDVTITEVYETTSEEVLEFDKIVLGCPSMGIEELEEEEFEPFFQEIENSLSNKKIALFGSYGWGDGEWMEDWEDRVLDSGAELFREKGLIINSTPSSDEEEDCVEFGEEFAEF